MTTPASVHTNSPPLSALYLSCISPSLTLTTPPPPPQAVLRTMEVQIGVQQLEPLPPAAASPPLGANQRSEREEGHRDTGASADCHSEDTPTSQRDEKKVRPAARRCMSPMGLQLCVCRAL